MANSTENSPKFMDVRWAGCSNQMCGHFNRTRRCAVPLPGCRYCGEVMRTSQWNGWKAAKLRRRKIIQAHLKQGKYPGAVLESDEYEEQAVAEAERRDKRLADPRNPRA